MATPWKYDAALIFASAAPLVFNHLEALFLTSSTILHAEWFFESWWMI